MDEAALEVARHRLRVAASVVVMTGAGISTESGIPDFRGPDGLWTRDPAAPARATLSHYLSDREARVEAWRRRTLPNHRRPEPNRGHRSLVRLEATGRLHLLITQNVDGLHLEAGHDPARVVELHGSLRRYRCLGCGDEGAIELVLERVRHGEPDPRCVICGGILKSAAISFGQALPREELERAERACREADLLIAVGTRLEVFPAASLPALAISHGADLMVVNEEPTRYDRRAAAVLRGPIGEVLPALVGAV